MRFLVLAGCILVIFVWIAIACAAKKIAVMKGHSEKKYFWYTLFIMPVGLSLVIALPDMYARPNNTETEGHDETLPEL